MYVEIDKNEAWSEDVDVVIDSKTMRCAPCSSSLGEGSYPPPDAISFQTMQPQAMGMMGTAPAMMGGTAGAHCATNGRCSGVILCD